MTVPWASKWTLWRWLSLALPLLIASILVWPRWSLESGAQWVSAGLPAVTALSSSSDSLPFPGGTRAELRTEHGHSTIASTFEKTP